MSGDNGNLEFFRKIIENWEQGHFTISTFDVPDWDTMRVGNMPEDLQKRWENLKAGPLCPGCGFPTRPGIHPLKCDHFTRPSFRK